MKRVLVLLAVISAMSFSAVQAQNYKHSVGIIVGTYEGANYKGWFGENFALDATIAYGWPGGGNAGLILNAAGLYQSEIAQVKGLNWFAGGGLMGGVNAYRYGGGYMGLHAMGGIEYNFNPHFKVPLVLSFDMRPGVGFNLGDDYYHNYYHRTAFLSWPVNLTLRYAF